MPVSIRDVAAVAGVSVGTVSNVLNDSVRVAPATVARVQAAVASLGYVRNDAARQLRVGRSSSVGMVVLDVRNPFFTDVARGAEHRAAEAGLTIMLGNSDEDAAREAAYLDLFEQQRAFGVLVSPIGDVTARLRRLRDRGIPVVLVDRTADDATLSSVSVDDVTGGRLAAEHLAGLDRRRIAFVGGPSTLRQAADRLQGARSVLPGIEPIRAEAMTVEAGRSVGVALRDRAADLRPDAVFAANDLLSIGVLQGLLAGGSGIQVPRDVAIVGYDDIDFAAAAVVPLSSVRQPTAEMGRTALDLLLAEAADPGAERRQLQFVPELVARASTVG